MELVTNFISMPWTEKRHSFTAIVSDITFSLAVMQSIVSTMPMTRKPVGIRHRPAHGPH
ncbi:MAG: hypothetical protein OJF47_001562 [Nitrospira sp.]|nr:MAG: hypothetical protein OJF47_001562 [Nitrospira sp.]